MAIVTLPSQWRALGRRLARRGRSGWGHVRRHGPALRVAGAMLAALGLLSVAVIVGEAQEAERAAAGVSLDDLSDYPTHLTVDRFIVKLSDLTATESYQVTVSSDSTRVGIGGCGTSSQQITVTGVASRELAFLVYACAVGEATVTAEVRRTGASSPEASSSRTISVEAVPEGAIGASGAAVRTPPAGAVAKAGTPGSVPDTYFDAIGQTSARANWGLPSDGGQRLTGYGLLFWRDGTTQPPYSQALVRGPEPRNYTYSDLQPNTTYRWRIHACNEANSCGIWTVPVVTVTTLPTPATAPTATPTPVPTATPAPGRPDQPHTIKIDDPAAGSTSLTVRWSAAANTGGRALTRFQVRRRTVPGSWPPLREAAAVGASARSHTYDNLTPGTTYAIQVRACNGSTDATDCSDWSAKATKTVPNSTPSFGTTTIAHQLYHAGQAITALQLPQVSGGDGTVEYTIAPPLANGLRFNATTRTISGTPTSAAHSVSYTYTAKDRDQETAQLSFFVTVFDVAMVVRIEYDDERLERRLENSRWLVLEHGFVRIRNAMSRADDYQFQLRKLPTRTGFLLGQACDSVPPPSDQTLVSSPWVRWNDAAKEHFHLARCALGTGAAVPVEIWIRLGDQGEEVKLVSRQLTLPQAWHEADHEVTYYVIGTDGNKINGITRGTQDGLFPASKPGHLTSHTLNPGLTLLSNYDGAASAWTTVGSAAVKRAASDAGADVLIVGYWDPHPDSVPNPNNGNDGMCGRSIACVFVTGPNPPHLGSGRQFRIEDPPHWGGEDDSRTWTASFKTWMGDRDVYQYLPAVLMHEYGHTIGLGHSIYSAQRLGGADVMAGAVREIAPCSVAAQSECGLSPTDKRGARGTYAHHRKGH